MKKQLSVFASSILLAGLALSSCTGTVDEGYTNVIPADASYVVSFNIIELAEMSGSKDYKLFSDAVNESYAERISPTAQVVDSILENPSKSGVDLDAPIYIFGQPDGVSRGIVLRISDKEKAEPWLIQIASSQGTGSEHRLYWDEKTLLIYEKDGSAEWQQPATTEAQFNQTESFKRMKEQKGEVRGYFLTRDLMKKYSYNASTPKLPLYGQTSILGACSFEQGVFVLKAALVANTPEAEEALTAFKTAFTPAKGKYAECLPESTTFLVTLSGKGSSYLEYLNRTPGAEAIFANNYNFWEGLSEMIDGEALIALTGISNTGFSLIAYADLGEAVTEQQMKEVLSRWSLDGAYWGIDNHRLYWTNDKALADNAFKKASPSFSSSDYSKQMNGKSAYMLMDFTRMAQYPDMQQAVSQMGAGGALQSFANLSGMEYELNKDYEFVMRVNLKDKKENALKQIISLLVN